MNREVVFSSDAAPAIGPYSQAIKASGNFLFLSGQIPLKPDGTLVTGDVREQAKQVMTNVRALLRHSGVMPENVVKTTIYLSSMDHFQAVNEVYGELFAARQPARSTVAVAGLPRGVDLEIDLIAVY